MDFSSAVKQLQIQRGWRREELALRLGKSAKTIEAWERRDRTPSRKACALMAELAEGEVAEFFAAAAGLIAVRPAAPRPEPRLTPISHSFNREGLQQALADILDMAPEAIREHLARTIEDYHRSFCQIPARPAPSPMKRK